MILIMQQLKARLKTVQEMLTHANFIRIHAEPGGASEANDLELKLTARKEELEAQIAAHPEARKTKKKKAEPELAHAE